MSISIFAKRAFLNTKPDVDFEPDGTKPNGYLKRVSSIIRADQIAQATNAKLNPKSNFKRDVCIYVKPNLNENGDIDFVGKSNYLDVIDELGYVEILKKHPDVGALTLSERDAITLASQGIKNKIVFIPQHHCNFDRLQRTRSTVKTIGIIGTSKAFAYIPPELKEGIEKRGLKLLEFSTFFQREDIVDFYQTIDIQLVWRPYRKKLANPLKIVNAASFGIPTIALDEIYFKEMGNCYLGVRDTNQFFSELDNLLAKPNLYTAYSELCQRRSEDYHIEKIAKLYKSLK